jgi:Tfp pilus assembly protein FimV
MFEPPLDIEQAFGQHGGMTRTRVRRRRVTATLVAMMIGTALMGPVARAVTRPQMTPAASRTYVVRSGDTLWGIAGRLAPQQDPRVLVQALSDANHVDAGSLVPGQTLVIPASG